MDEPNSNSILVLENVLLFHHFTTFTLLLFHSAIMSDPTRFIQFTGIISRTISRTVVTSHHYPVDNSLEKKLMNGVHSIQQWH
jgi:hypothetical protein